MTAAREPAPTSDMSQAQSLQHAGARWWSLDIHAHSPASFDYGGLEGRTNSGPKPSFKNWIQVYIAARVDGIVVTDHNSHDGIDRARQALEELRAEDAELPPFVIFPGVEITATGGIHILGVFDPASDADTVNQALALCRYTGTRGASDQTANMTVADVAAEITGLGGICIPAHADQSRIFGMDERELAALADSPHLLAVNVVDDAQVDTANRHGWVPPEIEAKAPGTHLTLIKAKTLDLDGVRLALTDPGESVRRCRSGYDDLNATSHGHISRVQVVRADVAEEYRFGPWMIA